MHSDSLWDKGWSELENGLFPTKCVRLIIQESAASVWIETGSMTGKNRNAQGNSFCLAAEPKIQETQSNSDSIQALWFKA